MKIAAGPVLKKFGFRNVLVFNCLIATGFLAINGLFTTSTPVVLILAILLIGGFFRSLQFTSLMALSFADIDQANMSRATTLR